MLKGLTRNTASNISCVHQPSERQTDASELLVKALEEGADVTIAIIALCCQHTAANVAVETVISPLSLGQIC